MPSGTVLDRRHVPAAVSLVRLRPAVPDRPRVGPGGWLSVILAKCLEPTDPSSPHCGLLYGNAVERRNLANDHCGSCYTSVIRTMVFR